MVALKQRIFAVFEELTQLRYERPVLGWALITLQWVVAVTIVLALLWGIASTPVGQMLGLTSLKERAVDGYNAYHWARKGIPSAESLPITPQRHGATIERAGKGMLLITYYDKGASTRRLIKLSNVDVTDEAKFDRWAQAYVLKPVTVDFYMPTEKYSEHDVWAAVVWSAKKPINVELVEQGIGVPEYNPPTTAVNLIFSQWYLKKAAGE